MRAAQREQALESALPARRKPLGKGDLPWLAALWAAAVLFFWPVLFGGKSFYFRDTIVYYYPQARLTAHAFSQGRLPVWQPEIGLGYPYAADPHSLAFYPLAALLAMAPMPRAYDLFVWLHVPLAGTFLYILLRRWRLGRPAAAVGAAAFIFSGFLVGTTCLTIVLRGVAWMPLVLATFDLWLEHGGRGKLAATAFVLAIQVTSTEPQHVFFTVLLMLALPWLRPVEGPPDWKRALAGTAAAGAGAAALAAVQLVPLAQLFAWSARATGMGHAEMSGYQIDPRQWLNFVLPAAFPDPASAPFLASFPGGVVPLYPDLFFGLPLLALAALAFRALLPGRGDGAPPARSLLTLAVMAAGGLALSVGDNLPFFSMLMTLVPPLGVFRYPSKYVLFPALAVPLAAAGGVEALVRAGRVSAHAHARWLGALAIAGGLGALLLLATGTALPAAYLSGERMAAGGISPELVRQLSTCWLESLAAGAGATLAAASALWASSRGRLPHTLATAMAACCALGLLVRGTHGSYSAADDRVLTEVPSTSLLMKKLRIGAPPPRFVTYPPVRAVHFGETETVLDRLRLGGELMTQLRGVPYGCNLLTASPALRLESSARLETMLTQTEEPDRLAALAGARFSLSVDLPDGPSHSGTLLGRSRGVSIRELAAVSPRAFVAHQALPLPAGSPAPGAEAILALPDTAMFEPPASWRSAGPLAPVTIHACAIDLYEPGRVRIRVALEGRGLLVLLDEFYPGWEARVDGVERPIVRVAGLFRGVEVRGGDRVVEMHYGAGAIKAGAAVSLLALVGLALLMRRRSTAKRRAPPSERSPQRVERRVDGELHGADGLGPRKKNQGHGQAEEGGPTQSAAGE